MEEEISEVNWSKNDMIRRIFTNLSKKSLPSLVISPAVQTRVLAAEGPNVGVVVRFWFRCVVSYTGLITRLHCVVRRVEVCTLGGEQAVS